MDAVGLRVFMGIVHMEDVLANSYKDLHVKGLDYICVHRCPRCTTKLYFFDECDNSDTPEVVCPHDHRYDFVTEVLAGELTDLTYRIGGDGERMNRFEYRTPLNGGDGFRWAEIVRVAEAEKTTLGVGRWVARAYDQIHTIRVNRNTVLCLTQFADEVADDTPTSLFTFANDPPALTGLYNRFTPDQINRRLNQIGLPSIRE